MPPLKKNCIKEKGFTLIELSIVIVIIGLIVAGVVGGKSLVHQASFRKLVTDAEMYKSALLTFQSTYNQLPGDIPNAYSYWPNAGCSDLNVDSDSAGCNGNGNGIIEGRSANNFAVSSKEARRLWQHLSLASIIPGNYSGIGTPNIGFNAPGSAFGTGVEMDQIMVSFARVNTTTGGISGSAFYPVDMYALDKKIDDGVPYTGLFTIMAGYEYKTYSKQGNPGAGNGFCRQIPYGESGGNLSEINLSSTIKACRCSFYF